MLETIRAKLYSYFLKQPSGSPLIVIQLHKIKIDKLQDKEQVKEFLS